MTATRRLAAILAADVVGYSRLMEQDEAGTLAALKERRTGILAPLVAAHHGRIVKVMGDGVLVEFASAVNAVACAVELQKKMAAANESFAEDRRIVLRIGINLGDVVVEGGDLYGDGVNVAARLQQLAEPGGICVSGKLHDEVGRKLPLTYDHRGEQTIKNMATPIRVYRIVGDGRATAPYVNSPAAMKPSIAVLPFTNMSGYPEQQYFSDGVTDDIITELSRFQSLFVIARNSSFQYGGGSIDLKRVGRELGVRYVVEGSVKRLGDRLRITAQLIDSTTGVHLWAERYDREVQEIYAVQDDVTQRIVGALAVRLEAHETHLAKRRPPQDMRAYDYCLRGSASMLVRSLQGVLDARSQFESAIAIDPTYAGAYSGLAYCINLTTSYKGWGLSFEQTYEEALQHAQKAVSLDDTDYVSHLTLGWCLIWRRNYQEAKRHFDRAFALNPNDANALVDRAFFLGYVGEPELGIDSVKLAMRLNPHYPSWYLSAMVCCCLMARRYPEAIAAGAEITDVVPQFPAWMMSVYGHAGRFEEARQAAGAFVQNIRPIWVGDPAAGLKEYVAFWLSDNPFRRQEDYDHIVAGIRNAGLEV